MTDGMREAACLEVDEDHDNTVRVMTEHGVRDCCAACFVQGGDVVPFVLVMSDDDAPDERCPTCMRWRVLEDDDPHIEQRRRMRAEGRAP